MKKLKKYIAMRLIALLMFPYSASAAAACNTQLDYAVDNEPVIAYESASYNSTVPNHFDACAITSNITTTNTTLNTFGIYQPTDRLDPSI